MTQQLSTNKSLDTISYSEDIYEEEQSWIFMGIYASIIIKSFMFVDNEYSYKTGIVL